MTPTRKFVKIDDRLYQIWKSHYPSNGAPAFVLGKGSGLDQQTAIVFSVNMDHGQDHQSKDLPPNCFYVAAWREEIKAVIMPCVVSGHFRPRPDLPKSFSGHVYAEPWEYVE